MNLQHSGGLIRRTILTIVFSAFLIAALAATAQAAPRDANRDGIPDRWERKHHLSLKSDQSRKDQDHDGVANLCEHQAGTSPRRKDSDRDRRRDGAEDSDRDRLTNASESRSHSDCGDRDSDDDGLRDDDEGSGIIVSFENGVLTIKTFDGETLSGTVDELTKIECGCHDDAASSGPGRSVTVAHDGEDESGDDGERDNRSEEDGDRQDRPVEGGGGDRPSDDSEPNHDNDDDENCASSALVAGATVHEAILVDGRFAKIELAG